MKLCNTFILITSLLSSSALCATTNWQIKSAASSIIFTGTQNNAPVSGKFTAFAGDVVFNLEKINESKAVITVDMDSVTTSYPLVAETLKTDDWFDAKKFPKAIFKSTSVSKTGDKTYRANGTLTIRDKTVPVAIDFTLEKSTPQELKASGSTTVKRTAFGIGKGEWANTTDIKDEIKIDFTVTATQH